METHLVAIIDLIPLRVSKAVIFVEHNGLNFYRLIMTFKCPVQGSWEVVEGRDGRMR